jgi:hypothetical protein
MTMRKINRIVQLTALSLIFSAVTVAQSDWIGSYEFHENGGKTAGGSVILVSHEINVIDSGDGLTATIQSNGYQTSTDLVCTAKIEGSKLLIYFQNYGEDNMFESYRKGDLLLTLERKAGKGEPLILTHWGKFTPSVPKNEKTGKVYFEPVKKTKS